MNLKAVLDFLEVPNAEQRRLNRHHAARMRDIGCRITPDWRCTPRYQKILLVLGWLALLAAAVLGLLK